MLSENSFLQIHLKNTENADARSHTFYMPEVWPQMLLGSAEIILNLLLSLIEQIPKTTLHYEILKFPFHWQNQHLITKFSGDVPSGALAKSSVKAFIPKGP